MADIRAIVFDFDGVLANSEPLHLLAYQAVLDELGIALDRDEYYTHLLGFDDVRAFKVIGERRGRRGPMTEIAAILARKTVIFDDIVARGVERRALSAGGALRQASCRGNAARDRLGRAAPRDCRDPAAGRSRRLFPLHRRRWRDPVEQAGSGPVSAGGGAARRAARAVRRDRGFPLGHRVGEGRGPPLRRHHADLLGRRASRAPTPSSIRSTSSRSICSRGFERVFRL